MPPKNKNPNRHALNHRRRNEQVARIRCKAPNQSKNRGRKRISRIADTRTTQDNAKKKQHHVMPRRQKQHDRPNNLHTITGAGDQAAISANRHQSSSQGSPANRRRRGRTRREPGERRAKRRYQQRKQMRQKPDLGTHTKSHPRRQRNEPPIPPQPHPSQHRSHIDRSKGIPIRRQTHLRRRPGKKQIRQHPDDNNHHQPDDSGRQWISSQKTPRRSYRASSLPKPFRTLLAPGRIRSPDIRQQPPLQSLQRSTRLPPSQPDTEKPYPPRVHDPQPAENPRGMLRSPPKHPSAPQAHKSGSGRMTEWPVTQCSPKSPRCQAIRLAQRC